jgi:hypothetical protein
VRFGRQLDDGQPEIVDAFYDCEETCEAHRLGDVTIRMELITPQDICLRRRGSQDKKEMICVLFWTVSEVLTLLD